MSTTVGLCAGCRHARISQNRRGSQFWRCALSRVDPRFPRYPRLPVLRCAGHEPGEPGHARDAAGAESAPDPPGSQPPPETGGTID